MKAEILFVDGFKYVSLFILKKSHIVDELTPIELIYI